MEQRQPESGAGEGLSVLEPLDQPSSADDARESARHRFYVPVRHKFAAATVLALGWLVLSMLLSRPWIDDLETLVGSFWAWYIVLFVALVPGFLNVFLVVSLLFDRPPALREAAAYPAVTILIAAYNEEAAISETLRSIRQQDYEGPVEVVVIDDGSTDRTREVVLGYPLPGLRLIEGEHGGKAVALNLGLAEVATDFVVTIDADTFLHPQALRRVVSRMLQDPPRTAAVAGSVLARNSRESFMARMQEWDYFLAISSVKRQQALYQGTLVAQGAFSLYRTEAVRASGGWPDSIGEDIVLTWSMIEQGHRIGFEPTAVGFTDVPTTLQAFGRQRKRWARGMIEGFKTHGGMLRKPLGLVGVLVAVDLLFPLLDATYTLVFLPGVALALTGRFWIAGPMTLAVLPLTALISYVMYRHQARVFDELGLHIRKNRLGFVVYLVLYQLIMSPVCVLGYAEELLNRRRRW